MAPKEEAPIVNILRTACLATYPFAFALSIAHTATSNGQLFPAISLLPQTASFLFSGAVLHFSKQHKALQQIRLQDDAEKQKRRITNATTFLGDTILAVSLTTCMVFSWITLQNQWGHHYYSTSPGETMLGTYATVPFMINM